MRSKKIKLIILALTCLGSAVFAQTKMDTVPNVPDHYVQRSAKFRAEKATTGHIIFLGNSITEGGNWRKLLKDSSVLNRGISGDNTFGVIQRIDEIVRHKPSKIFILIGVNDLSKSIPNNIVIENIFSIVGKIKTASPKTRIFVQSILPVNPSVKGFMTRFSKQSDIIEINKQLAKYQEAMKYTFIDIYSQFTDAKNLLEASFTNDGLHLNEKGYQHWVAYLKKNKFL